ncbi:general secretion pathway protein GspE [beta proteobacterium AAP99]|nr:general secretion pathway protein GspE [beta proteobacterium AAP99]
MLARPATHPSAQEGASETRWAEIRAGASQARAQGRSLTDVWAELNGLSARDALDDLARQLGWTVIDNAGLRERPPLWETVPLLTCMQRHVVLLGIGAGEGELAAGSDPSPQTLLGVLTDPLDLDTQTWLRARAPAGIRLVLVLRADLDAYLAQHADQTRASDGVLSDSPHTLGTDLLDDEAPATVLSYARISAESHPVLRLVDSTLYDALKAGASDIHVESTANGLAVKYRLDGVLDPAGNMPGVELAQQVISRLKVLGQLDIAERRIPQDGSFRVRAEDRDIDLRLSIMPGVHGEDAVIRILDKQRMVQTSGSLTLDSLGLDADSQRQLRLLAQQAYGMLLVTGPTGSGKTTTLYGALTERHTGREKIITIEDPVEYQLPGVLQIPVHEKKGLTFARGLRSVLRHDPDIIMVGEIRDQETAEIAVQSALTGHLVFSTVHANSAYDVFSRFAHMGIDPYAFASALNGVWAQRLMRVNCERCAQPVKLTGEQCRALGLEHSSVEGATLRAGTGCGDCRGTGYRGRRAIAEVLVLDDEMRELIVRKAPVAQLKALARARGSRALRDAALALLLSGQTTVDEVLRVTLSA